MSGSEWTPLGLWLAVLASGVFHGVSPGMGWPLAVSAGLMERSPIALGRALLLLAGGHLAAILMTLAPFAMLVVLLDWQRAIRIGASLLVIVFGTIQFLRRSHHPRLLARIAPSQIGLWSFAVAIAHGAGLMLVPIYLGLCRAADLDGGHRAMQALGSTGLATAVLVSVAHTLAMIGAGGLLAWLAYRYLGPKLVSRSWFNLDAAWAGTLILVGIVGLGAAIMPGP